jgi:hypothetical protein
MAEPNGLHGFGDDDEEHPVYSARFVHHLWFPNDEQIEVTADPETDSVALHIEDGFLYVIATFDPEELSDLAEELESFSGQAVDSPSGSYSGPLRVELHLFDADLTPGGADGDVLSFTLSEADEPDIAVVCHVDQRAYDRVVSELRTAAREFPKPS